MAGPGDGPTALADVPVVEPGGAVDAGGDVGAVVEPVPGPAGTCVGFAPVAPIEGFGPDPRLVPAPQALSAPIATTATTNASSLKLLKARPLYGVRF